MTAEKMVSKLVNMCIRAVKEENYKLISEAFSLCFDWNDKHPEEREIFMCTDDEEYVMVEDDVIYFNGARF